MLPERTSVLIPDINASNENTYLTIPILRLFRKSQVQINVQGVVLLSKEY